MKRFKTITNKEQFVVIVALTLLFAIRAYAKTIDMMTVPNSYMKAISMITIILGTGLVVVVSYLALVREWDIYKVYPVIGLTLGILFITNIPIFLTPDETYHFAASYELSNDILRIDHPKNENKIYMRDCDDDYEITLFKAGAYQEFGKTFQEEASNKLVTKNNYAVGEISESAYIMPALGITLARLLKLNFSWLAIVGTFFNMAWFVLWMTYALKKIPFGKRILLTLLLLPMTLQEVSSFSRDNCLIASGILVTTLALCWKYDRENVKWYDAIVFAVASYNLITVKSATYAYMILFVVFISVNKKWFTSKYAKWIIAAVIIAVIVFLIPLRGGEKIYAVLNIEWYQANTGTCGYSALYFLSHPGHLFDYLKQTFGKYGDDYVLQLTGNGIGWLEVPNSVKARVIYITLAILAAVRVEDEKEVGIQTRVFGILFGLAGIFLCEFAMLLFWTAKTNNVIEGVQGRYFLPILLPLFLGVGYWKKPTINAGIEKYYPIILAGMGYVVALGVIRFNIV